MAKRPDLSGSNLPPLELPGALSTQTSKAWAKSIGADQLDADGVLKGAAKLQSDAAFAWDAFNALRTNRNPAVTPAAHLAALDQAVNRLQKSVLPKTDESRRQLRLRAEEIDREVEKLIMRPSDDAAEIRSVLRGLPLVERDRAVRSAIDSGDLATLHAVFRGKPITTGLTSDSLTKLREYAERKLASDLHKQKQLIAKAEKLVTAVVSSTIELGDLAAGSAETRKHFSDMAAKADMAALEFTKMTE